MNTDFQTLQAREWRRMLARAGRWAIDHAPGSYHRRLCAARAWRLFCRLRGERVGVNP